MYGSGTSSRWLVEEMSTKRGVERGRARGWWLVKLMMISLCPCPSGILHTLLHYWRLHCNIIISSKWSIHTEIKHGKTLNEPQSRNWLHGLRAVIGFEGSLGLPAPILLTAVTRYSYTMSSNRSFTNRDVSGMGSLLRNTQCLEILLRRSTWYPMIGVPPSLAGAFQTTFIDVAKTSTAVGAAGVPGTATDTKHHHRYINREILFTLLFHFIRYTRHFIL